MKRSTKLIIIVLAVAVLLPVIFITIMATKLPNISDIVSNVITNDNTDYVYNMKVTSPDRSMVPDCYILVTTYSGNVDTLSSVNFVDPATGAEAKLVGDSIIVNLHNVSDLTADGLCLTVELPAKSKLLVENSVPTVDVHVVSADIQALRLISLGDFLAQGANLGAFMSTDTTHTSKLVFEGSNIGALKLNGGKTTLDVKASNVGAMAIAGTCDAIEMNNSNVGVCSWNKANSTLAVMNNTSIVSKVTEGSVDITIEDDEKESDNDTSLEVVNVSVDGVFVESEGDKVEVTPKGVFVDSDDTKVEVTPAGVVVKENGEEVVNIGIGGVKVK